MRNQPVTYFPARSLLLHITSN